MLRITLAALLISTTAGAHAALPSPPALFPRPKEITWRGAALPMPAGAIAIVVGQKATDPEKYAAGELHRYVSKRFKADWPVVTEKSDLRRFRFLVILGQRSTCHMLDDLCRRWKVMLSDQTPGWDGYAITTGRSEGRTVAIVGGSTPRGVVYGQDTLFQLVRKRGSEIVLWPALIRDWPSVKWRGRPHSDIARYDRPGTFDAFAQARVNFVDLRCGSRIYGTPPDFVLDKAKVSWELNEAHKRGLFVFATVDCAVPPEQHNAVIAKFEEYLKMGADGIYISIDDPGADFRQGTSIDLLKRIVELGRRYGITGDKLAIVPGKESYKSLDTQTNYKTGHVQGLQEILLFATVLPSLENLKKHLANGFTTPPSWWHNWPRPRGGFSHNGNRDMRVDGILPYMYLSRLSEGWRNPSDESLRGGGKFIRGVMPWGASVWGPEYVAHVICQWGWNTEDYDWSEQRARIYDIVYGPDGAAAAAAFDDGLEKLEQMFVMAPDQAGTSYPGMQSAWPPILRNPTERETARHLLDTLYAPLEKLESSAAKGSLLDEDILKTNYLTPMRANLDLAKIILDLPCPEYWWNAQTNRVLMAAKMGNVEQTRKWQEEGAQRAVRDAQTVADTLAGKVDMTGYVDGWKARTQSTYASAARADRAPDMRGDLSDPIWRKAPMIGSFGESEDSPDRTEVRLLYTDDALYVGYTCFESTMNNLSVQRTVRNSDVWEDDDVELFINTDGLLYPHFQFGCNPNGVQFEAAIKANGDKDPNWRGDWQVKTARAADRWTAEFKIPYKTLNVDLLPTGCIWMCNFCRTDHANAGGNPSDYNTSSYGGGGSFHDTGLFRPVWFR